MTNQEIFETVCKHLLTQNCKSINENFCCYRGPNNTKCAVGCLIPDELYDPIIEGCALNGLGPTIEGVEALKALVQKTKWSDSNINLLCTLQRMHDNEPVHHWPRQLKLVANIYELSSDFMSEIKHVS